MKVAMIGTRGLGSNYGGIERVLDELCPRLVTLGYEVDVYSHANRSTDLPAGLRSIKVPSFGGKHFENLTQSVWSTIRATGKYDIAHFHATGPGILSALARLTGQKSVVTVHALDQNRAKWGPAARLALRLAESSVTRFADEVTVVSEDLRRYFRERYDRSVRFLPNGLPTKSPVSAGAFLASHGLTSGDYFLFASRLTPEKGCHDLIAAFNQVDTPLKLAIAGKGPAEYVEHLKQIADPDRVVFLGHLGGAELAEAFSNTFMFVLPSYIEGMSMALLEAISYRLPILVSDIGANLSVGGDAVFSFPVGNVSALTIALNRYAHSSELVEAGRRNLEKLHLPDWDEVAARYDQLYRALSASSPTLVTVPTAPSK